MWLGSPAGRPCKPQEAHRGARAIQPHPLPDPGRRPGHADARTVGAEEERTRIARDLHDRIGQSLAYLAFELDRIVKSDSRGNDIGVALDRLRTDVRDVVREVRNTLYDLRTDVSDTTDLAEVLELSAQRMRERSGLDVSLRARASARLPLLQERELFRIAQEALANIEKHAAARHVVITWDCDGTSAVLEIVDDGRGFAGDDPGHVDSYGIVGMHERADSVSATLQVESSPGAGTHVRCVVGAAPERGEDRGHPPSAR